MSGVPVLAFHAIENGPEPLRIAPNSFRDMMLALRDAGAEPVTPQAIAEAFDRGWTLPARAVSITFDDGYASVHEAALPVLADLGWPAAVFPVTAQLGGRNSWDRGADAELQLLSRSAVAELSDAGWEIGGHTHTHPDLRSKDAPSIEAELAAADDVIADITGTVPESFAYPFGYSNALVRRIAGTRYRGCWEIGAQRAERGQELSRLARVEAWYVRNPLVLRRLHTPAGSAWLAGRRALRNLKSRGKR